MRAASTSLSSANKNSLDTSAMSLEQLVLQQHHAQSAARGPSDPEAKHGRLTAGKTIKEELDDLICSHRSDMHRMVCSPLQVLLTGAVQVQRAV
jgi:hypothetical protein